MNTPLYFAYGSNMLQERIERRVGKIKKIGLFNLAGWRMEFDFYGVAVLIEDKTPGAHVEGILYYLDDGQIYQLDMYEGWPSSYRKFYLAGANSIIFLYNKVKPFIHPNSRPNLDYLNLIIAGAIENDLEATAKRLILYKVRNYKLFPKKRKHEKDDESSEQEQEENSGRKSITSRFKVRKRF